MRDGRGVRARRSGRGEHRAGHWPPSRSWTGASSTTCTGRAAATPTSTTWWSAPEGSSSSTRRPGPGTSRWPTGCCGRTGIDASGTCWRRWTRRPPSPSSCPGWTRATVKPVLCFDREQPVFGWSREVMVCSTVNVATLLTSRPSVLDHATLRATAETLAQSLKAATDPIVPIPPKRQVRRRSDVRHADEETPEPDPFRGLDPRSRPARLPRPRGGTAEARVGRRGPGPRPDRSEPRPR